MKRLLFVALALASTTASALDLKGIKLGMTREEFLALFPEKPASLKPLPNTSICFSNGGFCGVNVGTIAGIPMTLNVNFIDGKVADVYSGRFDPAQFEQVVEALKSKFGPPTTTAMGKVQNRMGNSFDNPHYVWKFPEGELRASRFMPGARTLDISELRIASKEWLAGQAAKEQTRNADL